MWRLISVALILLLAMSISVNWVQQRLIRELGARPASVPADEPLIRRAAALWARNEGLPEQAVLDADYGKVVRFSDKACVSLQAEVGAEESVVPVYCFDSRTGALVWKYEGQAKHG